MTALLKTTLAAALMSGAFFAQASYAEDVFEVYSGAQIETTTAAAPRLSGGETIAVARLDGGRFIPTPYGETEDWTFLDRRVDANVVQLGASAYIKYVPELPYNALAADNKIDEVRLTAANEGFKYVLIYGVGVDASWASFGGLALQDTGLSVKPDCAAWEQAKAKALLINSFTGDVLGAATADNIEYNIGELADEVEYLIHSLSPVTQSAELIVTGSNTEI